LTAIVKPNAPLEAMGRWKEAIGKKLMEVKHTKRSHGWTTVWTCNHWEACTDLTCFEMGARALPRFGGGASQSRAKAEMDTTIGNFAAIDGGRN
jgi:hypothetical protein